MPTLTRIQIYPVKSLDAQIVAYVEMLPIGALRNDRRFELRDKSGDVINGKRMPAVHRLRSRFDPTNNRLALRAEGAQDERLFDVYAQRPELLAWLSDFFSQPVNLAENDVGGFPDDTESPGPTLVSVATLRAVADWFSLSLEEVRARFRANLEIDGVEPFWEDRLVGEHDCPVAFRIGEAELLGTNPCQRCPVPTRDSTTGEPTPQFARLFARQRQESLPEWAPRSRFDHFYRLAVNTRKARFVPATLRVGDSLELSTS